MRRNPDCIRLGRRAFLKNSSVILGAASVPAGRLFAGGDSPRLRIGLVTDLHYADKPPAGTRFYRETPAKLEEAGRRFEQENPAFLVELGDLIDSADSVKLDQDGLKTINRQLAALCNDRHYVLGNHCVEMLTKEEFLEGVEREKSYYSFDRGGFHFVVLDSCFLGDGAPYGRKNFHWTDANIPAVELEWLRADLQAADRPVILFAHQRLDTDLKVGVKNNAEVRKILEDSSKVLAVFQGHSHQNDLNDLNGIHYCTLAAMIEGSGAANSGYALLEIEPNGTIHLTGFRNQKSYDWVRRG